MSRMTLECIIKARKLLQVYVGMKSCTTGCVTGRSPGETSTAALGTTNTQSTVFLGAIRYFLRKAKHKVHSSEGRARAGNSLADQTCRGPCFLDQEVVLVGRGRADTKAPASRSVSLQPLHRRCFPNT